MAEIIGFVEKPKITTRKRYKATCDKCGAIVVFEEDELKDDYCLLFDYEYEYVASYATCPNCSNTMFFNKNTHRL